jgi:ATP-binding cassette subfamily F protein 3
MAFVQLDNISLAFADREILRNVHLSLNESSRVALSGANGSGKSTLMRIVAGLRPPDAGRVIRERGVRVSYLPQDGVVHSGSTLREEVERAYDRLHTLIREQREIEQRLGEAKPEDESTDALVERHHQVQETILASGYYEREADVHQVLTGLGFSEAEFTRPTEEFSGGWQMRIALAKVLLERADILLLDEPTNYLDLEARNWLEGFLQSFSGGVCLVSHDRYFLDVTVREVAELFRGTLTRYRGNYSEYERLRREALAQLLDAYRRQQEEIARIEDFIRRFRYNASKARQVQSRIKQLEKMDRIEIPESMKKVHFSFPKAPHSGREVLRISGLTKAYGDHVVFQDLELLVERGSRMVIAGPNGAGKTTLMRIIAGVDTHFHGNVTYGTGVKVGYFAQDLATALNPDHTVVEEVEAHAPTPLIPQVRNLLGAFLFRGDEIYKPVPVLSGGEKSRLALLKLLLEPTNLLVLDEPTNHLDLTSKDVLLESLNRFEGTILFVSHDRSFIRALATTVLELGSDGPRLFPGDYDYYLWKTENESAEATDSREGPSAPEYDTDTTAGRVSRAEEKRRKSTLRRLEREAQELLQRIDDLDDDHRRLEEHLAEPVVYTNGERVREIKEEMATNRTEQEEALHRWEELEAELSTLSGAQSEH